MRASTAATALFAAATGAGFFVGFAGFVFFAMAVIGDVEPLPFEGEADAAAGAAFEVLLATSRTRCQRRCRDLLECLHLVAAGCATVFVSGHVSIL